MSKKINLEAFDEGGMDELLRTTVEGHRVEPDPGLWKGISRKLLLRELAHFNFTNLSLTARITGTAGLLVVAAALYFLIPGPSPVTPSENSVPVITKSSAAPVNTVPSTTSTSHTPAASVPATTLPVKAGIKTEHVSGKVPVTPNTVAVSPLHAQKQLIYANNTPKQLLTTNPDAGEPGQSLPAAVVAISPVASNVEILSPVTHLVPLGSSLIEVTPQDDTIITISNVYGIARYLVTKPNAAQFFSANFGVSPEMTFYTAPETYSKINVWVNAGLTCHFSRFSLATGLGLGYIYDKGNYQVAYKSNDKVGYYTNVVSYSVGANNEIIYNTVTKDVYDSLVHQNDYRTLNRYAYLQVPLLLGYRLFESGRVSLAFQAGPAVAFLLGSRKSSAVIEYANARVMRIDDNTPSRVKTNWQIWGDLLLEIRMTKRISLYVEPTYKYFFSPAVEQENINFKAPWSMGLGVGLQYNFATKRKNP